MRAAAFAALVHLAPVVVLATVALSPPPALAAPADLAGAWVLDADASQSIDALLEATGASWLERQAARAARPTQTITVDGVRVTFAVESTVKSSTEEVLADGVARPRTSDKGQAMTVRTAWEGDALVTVTNLGAPDGRPLRFTISRTIEGGGAVLRQRLEVVDADGKRIVADRVFRRAS